MAGRVTFAQLLQREGFDCIAEYKSLWHLVYRHESRLGNAFMQIVSRHFLRIPFRGTATSLEDYITRLPIPLNKELNEIELDDLLLFCEFVYSLACALRENSYVGRAYGDIIETVTAQVEHVVDKASHVMVCDKGCICICVEKDEAAIEVAEILSEDFTPSILGYHHRSMQGNLEGKKRILLELGSLLEPNKKELKAISQSLENDLFFALNNLNIRHNNISPGSKDYSPALETMSDDDLESWYDATYQACLEASLALCRSRRKEELSALKKNCKRQK